jgi:hypothetical protein
VKDKRRYADQSNPSKRSDRLVVKMVVKRAKTRKEEREREEEFVIKENRAEATAGHRERP